MPITIKTKKIVIARTTDNPGSAIARTRYVGILERDGVEIYRSRPRPYRSCAHALAGQHQADLESRGEL